MMSMNRRFFLKSGGIALASLGSLPASSFLQRVVFAQNAVQLTSTNAGSGRRKTLIAIFQRGAVDGLNVVVPYAEPEYYDYRPTIAVPKPDGGGNAAIDLNGHFGLHPSLTAFKPLWDDHRLAIVTAAGSPNNTRSHFDAQDYMESGTPGIKSTTDGWLNRYLQSSKAQRLSPFRAVSMTQTLPRSLLGKADAIAMTSVNDFTIRAGRTGADTAGAQEGFEALYEQRVNDSRNDSHNDSLYETGKETFAAINFLRKARPSQYKPEGGATYPKTRFGQSLLQIAQLIKAGVGLEVAFTDIDGWDTHVNEGSATQPGGLQNTQLGRLLTEFSTAIAAFVIDLGKERMDDVVILTMSEFGRTARENGNRGTDHGHANSIFVIGNAVRGGKIYGDWPGLKSSQLYEERDLDVTTDFRDVFAEILQKQMKVLNPAWVFPGYQTSVKNFRNFLS